MRLGTDETHAVEKIEKGCISSDKTTQSLMVLIDEISTRNDLLSDELGQKREKIIKTVNASQVSGQICQFGQNEPACL